MQLRELAALNGTLIEEDIVRYVVSAMPGFNIIFKWALKIRILNTPKTCWNMLVNVLLEWPSRQIFDGQSKSAIFLLDFVSLSQASP